MAFYEECKNFLRHKAMELMDKLQSGSTLGIQLPSVLTSRENKPPPPKKRTRPDAGTPERPKAKTVHHPSEEHRNMSPHGAWLCLTGKNFLDLFKDCAPSGKTWPKIVDECLPNKKKQFRSAPLCVRFQMTAKCTHGCELAHVFAKNLSKPEFNHEKSNRDCYSQGTHYARPAPENSGDHPIQTQPTSVPATTVSYIPCQVRFSHPESTSALAAQQVRPPVTERPP
jgi:hypothetical protein